MTVQSCNESATDHPPFPAVHLLGGHTELHSSLVPHSGEGKIVPKMPIEHLVLFGLSGLPPAFAAGCVLVAFIGWRSWWERRKRRAFRRSLESGSPDPQAEQPAGTPGAATSGGDGASASGTAVVPHHGTDPFPAFGSYFLDHLRSYGLAVLFVCLALVVRWLLEPALRGRLPYGFFLLAVIATALVADLWETMLALVLGFLMAVYFFVGPPGFAIGGADGWWGALVYWLIGLGILWFMKSEHTAWLRTLDRDIAYVDRLKELDRERASTKLAQADQEIWPGSWKAPRTPFSVWRRRAGLRLGTPRPKGSSAFPPSRSSASRWRSLFRPSVLPNSSACWSKSTAGSGRRNGTRSSSAKAAQASRFP